MVRIVLADDGIAFDGRSPEAGPLGGVESAVVYLVREMARRGHQVSVHNKCENREEIDGVLWSPIGDGLPGEADLYIANRGDKLLPLMPHARRTIFWIHNPARYLLKWRYFSKLWRLRPAIVFIGDYHASTYPAWAPGRRSGGHSLRDRAIFLRACRDRRSATRAGDIYLKSVTVT